MNDSSETAPVRESPSEEPAMRGSAGPGTAASAQARTQRSWRERLRLPLMWGVPLLLIAAGLYFYLTSGRYQSTDDAYVRAAQVQISADVSGRVSEVDVHDNQRVRRGQVLFHLDDRAFRIAVQAAQARLAGARLTIESLKAKYHESRAARHSASSELAYARNEYHRQSRLLAIGVASQSQVDRARLALQQARAGVTAARQRIMSVLARLGGNPDLPVDAHPRVERALAALNRAKLNLSYTTVRAPTDGIVTGVQHLRTGGYLPKATPAFVLVSMHDVWVQADFKENQLAGIRPGERATVDIDAYPGRTFHAVVASITPGTGAQFAILPPQNATGNWVKVVQRLGVRLRLKSPLPAVRSGLSATVTVDTRSGGARAAAGTSRGRGSAR